jgi:hypothetical protein
MRAKYAITIALVLLAGGQISTLAPAARAWKSGRVITISLSGHGPSSSNQRPASRNSDVWWNYCISANGNFYSVLSRQSPEKLGLAENSPIRFSENNNQIRVIVPSGKSVDLRIVRKDKTKKCP